MLSDLILEKIFSNSKVQKMPCSLQSDVIDVIEQIFSNIKEEQPYVSIAELLSTDE